MKWEAPSETLAAFTDGLAGKPYRYDGETQDDYILAGGKDDSNLPIDPTVMK